MKIEFKNPVYDYGCCNSCKNCLYSKHGWLMWCKKKLCGVDTYGKCYLYRAKRRKIK